MSLLYSFRLTLIFNSRINLETATETALKELESACEKATFGVDQTDVLDETYRKAGKMDLNRFASRLDVVSSGLLDAITPDLLVGQSVDSDKVLKAEIYKLNVYGLCLPVLLFRPNRFRALQVLVRSSKLIATHHGGKT